MRRCIAIGSAVALLIGGAAPVPRDPPFTPAERTQISEAMDLPLATVEGLGDAALTEQLLAHARAQTGLRLRPSTVDSRWTVEPPRRDLAGELRAARAGDGLNPWLATLSPTSRQYRDLQAGRGRYAALVARGGWGRLPDSPTLRPGDRAAEVEAVRARLAAEGYGAPEADAARLFDPELETAVRAFQESHALEADGVIGPRTLRALNVSAVERLGQIDANLERWRWLPASLPADRIEVDTGFQETVLFRGGAPALRMRAIVGSPKHPTPMFVSRVEAVIFNPPWNVPASIARDELLPAAAKRPGLLASMGIRWVDGRLQQRPGPGNALGQVKFDIPSRFGVYLHDTPGKGLFAQPVRAFSHGCIRLEAPRDLAVSLLAGQGGTRAFVEHAIEAGVTRRVSLGRPVPVYVLHFTVRSEAGQLRFRPDIYGWDRKVGAALARAG